VPEQASSLVPIVIPLATVGLGVLVWAALQARRSAARRARAAARRVDDLEASDPGSAQPELHYANFDEPTLAEVERAFELLIAQGRIRLETGPSANAGSRPLPNHLGGVYRRLLAQARRVELVEVQVSIALDACAEADDPIGGWRLEASPEEIDIRIAAPAGAVANPDGDAILDATWSPRGSGEIVVHSTILHFLVRSVVGDRLPG
jgi:hypothetical protein